MLAFVWNEFEEAAPGVRDKLDLAIDYLVEFDVEQHPGGMLGPRAVRLV